MADEIQKTIDKWLWDKNKKPSLFQRIVNNSEDNQEVPYPDGFEPEVVEERKYEEHQRDVNSNPRNTQ